MKNIRSNHGNPDFKYLYVALWGLARLHLIVKNPPVNAGNLRDEGSNLWSGRPPGEENGNPLQILAWRIPWAEEPGGLQSIESQRVGHN